MAEREGKIQDINLGETGVPPVGEYKRYFRPIKRLIAERWKHDKKLMKGFLKIGPGIPPKEIIDEIIYNSEVDMLDEKGTTTKYGDYIKLLQNEPKLAPETAGVWGMAASVMKALGFPTDFAGRVKLNNDAKLHVGYIEGILTNNLDGNIAYKEYMLNASFINILELEKVIRENNQSDDIKNIYPEYK